jgi:hypothetical protein
MPKGLMSRRQAAALALETGVDPRKLIDADRRPLSAGAVSDLLRLCADGSAIRVREELVHRGGRVIGELPGPDDVGVSRTSLGRTALYLPRELDWPPSGVALKCRRVPEGLLIVTAGPAITIEDLDAFGDL